MGPDALERRWSGHTPALLGARYRCAVLCPLAEVDGVWQLVFEVRAASLRRQPGEVCFPGGRMEPGEDDVTCALRETEEELAIPSRCVRVLGRGDFIASAAGFTLQPVLGVISAEGLDLLRAAPDEVAEVFTVPLSFFMDTKPEVYTYALTAAGPSDFPYGAVGIPADYRWSGGRVEVPLWRFDGRAIWGMTARIVRSLLPQEG